MDIIQKGGQTPRGFMEEPTFFGAGGDFEPEVETPEKRGKVTIGLIYLIGEGTL